jgi:molecular chaperone DnaK
VQNRIAKVLATGGDAFLGGGNFDEAIVEHFAQQFEQQTGISVRQNKTVMQRLVFAAEHTKIALSKLESAPLRVPAIAVRPSGEFVDFNYTLTRTKLNELVFQLVERCAAACDDVLERAHFTPDQVDELVMVGGQTRMPAIRERMKYFKKFAAEKDVHPELGVAVGAAILGRNLAKASRTGLMDVVPMPISVMLPGGRTVEAIAANTPVPAKRVLALEGLPPWSAPVPLVLFESLDQTSTDRELIGTVHIGPEWRTGKDVAASLELEMGQDFQLKARVVAPGGMQTTLQIVEAR